MLNPEMAEDDDNVTNVTCEDISQIPALQKLMTESTGFSTGFIRIHPYNQIFPTHLKNYITEIRDFEVFEDDIWVSSFPKSGTTWTQEMVWCIKNNVDVERARASKLENRVPFLEHSAIAASVPDKESFSDVRKMQRPRIIKTHFSFDMLPKEVVRKGARVVYVTRNPRDVCVSLFNHFRIFRGYTGTFEDIAQLFLQDICGMYTPFPNHVLGYWDKRDLPKFFSS